MKRNTPNHRTDPDERIAQLVRTLREAEEELQALTGGQLDAVISEGHAPYLLRDAQAKLRVSEAAQRALAETQIGILNALPAHIALLDSNGVIMVVNEAWRRFASANVLQSTDFFVGQNYLGVCESAQGEDAEEAQAVTAGIRKVLSGELKSFSIEYPCHSPTEKRWFRLMVTPLSDAPGTGAVVMHINVTERRQAEEVLRQKEREQRRLAEELTIETRRLHESQRVANVGSWETALATLEVKWTDETFRIFETSPDRFTPTHQGFLERVHPEDRQKVDDAFKDSIGRPGPFSIEHRLLFPEGRIKHIEERWQVFNDATGRPVRAIGTCQDITQRKLADELVRSRARQQEAIARIGFEATRATALEGIFEFATQAVAEALGVELCKVLQLAPDGSHLRLVSGVGWQAGLIGVGTVGVDRESQAGFTLKADGAIYVNDFAQETRFAAPPILRQHGVVSGLSVKIMLRDKPWGVLGAHSRTVRTFNGVEADFMEAVATLLAVVIERLAVQRTLTESEARMRDAQRLAHLGNWELDLAKNELSWSEEVFRIFGVEPSAFAATYESFFAFVHPDDRAAVQAAQQAVLSGRGRLDFEHRIIRPDGSIRHVRERGELIHDENGRPVALSGTVLDITDLRAAQSQAERMNALMSDAQRIADMGSWEMDLTRGILVWSEETCRLFGIRPEEFGGTFETFTGFILPEDQAAYSAVQAGITPGAPLLEAEYRIRRPDGEVRWMFERGRVLFDADGKAIRRLGVVMDITGRKRAEAALAQAEGNRLAVWQSSLDAIITMDESGTITDFNPAAEKIFGYRAADVIGHSLAEKIIPPAMREGHRRGMAHLRATGQGPIMGRRIELSALRSDGTEFPVELTVVQVAGADGSTFLGTVRDITEQKKAEAEAVRAAETLAGIVKVQQEIANVDLTLTDVMQVVAERTQALTGATGGVVEMVDGPQMVYTAVAGQVADRVGFRLNREGSLSGLAAATGTVLSCDDTETDSRVDLASCRMLGVRSMIVAPLHVSGEVVGALKVLSGKPGAFGKRDLHNLQILAETLGVVIQRHRAAEALRTSEAKFRRLAESNILGILFWEAQGNISDANDAFLQMVGYTREELERGQIDWRTITPPEYLPQDERALAEVLATGSCTPFEKEYLHKDGHRVPILLGAAALHSAKDQGVCFVVDISQQKQAMAALRVSEERFRLLSKATNDAIWDWNLITNQVWWNEGYEQLFGFARAEVDPTAKSWTDYIHPEDLARVTDGIHRVIEHGGESWSDEYRFRCKDGRYAHVLDRGHVIRDAAGKPVRMIGGMTDLTKLKEHEIALSESNRALQLLSRCNEALIRSETESGLLAAICQIAVDIGGFRLAWVGYALDDAQKTIACQSHAGIEDGYLSEVRVTWAENDPNGQGPAGKAIRHGEPVVISDLATDESFCPWLEAARARGFRGVIALPLADQQRTFGVFVLYLTVVRQPLPEEMRLLRELAEDMAFGIVTIRTRLDRQRIHAAVEQVAAAVSAATSADFFEHLVRNMVVAVGAQAGFVAKVLPGEPLTSRTIAAVVDNQVTANFDYVLQGTLCETFLTSETCVIHKQVAQQFPQSSLLAALGAEGFVGRRLTNAAGEFIGQLFVIFREPLKEAEFVASTLRIFSARAAAELERQETETQLREQAALLDKAQDAILVRDLNHHITYWNRSAERLFGWTAQEVLGRSVRELFFSEPVIFDRATEQLLAQGEWTGELRKKCKDGRMLDVEARWTLVRDAADQPKAVLAIHTDITERKAAEQAVQRSEERFRELAENIREVFWMTDPAKNQILYISPAYEKIWGRTCASLTEWPRQWLEAVHPDDRTRITEAVVTKQARGDYDEEYRIQRPDGTVRWILDRAFPVRDAAGEVIRIVGTAEDVTERRQHERLAQRSQRLESIGTLAGGIAHDLNNALAPVMLSVELLRMLYPAESPTLDTIQACTNRCADMVRQLLTFAKGAEGERVSLQPTRLVKELEKLMKGSFPKNIQLVVKYDPKLPMVRGDATQLHQVLLNLCVNARDAMPNGGTLTVEAESRELDAVYASSVPEAKPGKYVTLSVRDTGTGIPPEILDRIFDPFFTTKAPDKGTGLGLSTVMGIVKGHGGFLQVHSQPGQGSTFTAYLPAEAAGSHAEPVSKPAEKFRGKGETILFVDDEAAVREIARAVLRRLNFTPMTASDGADGLMQAAQHRTEIRAVITDLHMPNLDGLAFVRALRRMLPDIPIVVASGRMEDAVAAEFKTLGVTTRLDKPFTEAQLAEALKKLLAPK